MLKRSSHCVYSTHYHLVFTVKYRKALLRGEIEQSLCTISTEIEERYELEVEKLGADIDHVHLLCSFHPKYGIGQTVNLYKNVTATDIPTCAKSCVEGNSGQTPTTQRPWASGGTGRLSNGM